MMGESQPSTSGLDVEEEKTQRHIVQLCRETKDVGGAVLGSWNATEMELQVQELQEVCVEQGGTQAQPQQTSRRRSRLTRMGRCRQGEVTLGRWREKQIAIPEDRRKERWRGDTFSSPRYPSLSQPKGQVLRKGMDREPRVFRRAKEPSKRPVERAIE